MSHETTENYCLEGEDWDPNHAEATHRIHGEAGLDAKQVGRKPMRDERDRKLEQLARDKAKLQRELALARKVIELAGKAHEILGVALPSLENDEKL